MFKLRLSTVMLLLAARSQQGNAAALPEGIPLFDACGSDIEGTCTKGSECSIGTPSICLPIEPHANGTGNWAKVTGFGRPAYEPPEADATEEEVVDVFYACTDANFAGSCIQWSITCDACYGLGNGWTNVLSSIRILDSRVGCNFWVSSNCLGDGIKIDSGAIYNLAATNYNDRLVAFNCYLR